MIDEDKNNLQTDGTPPYEYSVIPPLYSYQEAELFFKPQIDIDRFIGSDSDWEELCMYSPHHVLQTSILYGIPLSSFLLNDAVSKINAKREIVFGNMRFSI